MEYLELIKTNIDKNIYHSLYDKTVSLKKLYTQLITGENADDLLKAYVPRESDDMFKQRVAITNHVFSCVSHNIMSVFKRTGRINNIMRDILIDGDEKKKKIFSLLRSYNGNVSVDEYLSSDICDFIFTDPNGFNCTSFNGLNYEPSGKVSGDANPYPIIFGSESIMNYSKVNNTVEWVIVRLQIDAPIDDKGSTKKADQFIYFDKFRSVTFTQFFLDPKINGNEAIWISEAKKKFIILVNEYKIDVAPIVQIGYERHKSNKNLFVSPIDAAIPYYKKTIKTVSEFDLTMCLHAFPQKFSFVSRCKAKGCNDGKLPDGDTCGVCKGSGESVVHSSSQDHMTLRLPKSKEDMVDLDKLTTYKYPPIDLLKFQDDQIEKLIANIKKTIFNSGVFEENSIVKTATEVSKNYDSVYDTLHPYANNISRLYSHIATVTCNFNSIYNVEVVHRFPKDLKFKSVNELLNDLKLANDSGAPGYIKKEISSDIAQAQFIDKPNELQRINVKQSFFPFQDKTKDEILYIISNSLCLTFDKILWANFDNIFEELEEEYQDFYLFDKRKIKELIKNKVEIIIAEKETQENNDNALRLDLNDSEGII